MIQAMVTVHSPLISPTWLFQGICKYGRKCLNLMCCNVNIWSAIKVHFFSQSMAEQLAENYHNTWGRKKKMELQAKGKEHNFVERDNVDIWKIGGLSFVRFFSNFDCDSVFLKEVEHILCWFPTTL